MAENNNEKEPEEEYKEKVKEEAKQEIEKEQTHEEALEEKEKLEKEARAEAELEHAKERGVAKSILSKGASVITGGLSTIGSKVKGFAEKKTENGKTRAMERPEPEDIPEGQNWSDLTYRQKEYWRETGKWPKIEGTMTQDYYEWKQEKQYTRGRPRGSTRRGDRGKAFANFGAIFGQGADRQEPGRNPLEAERKPQQPQQQGTVMGNIFERRNKSYEKPDSIFDERIDQTDKNPFKFSSGEKKIDNPFE